MSDLRIILDDPEGLRVVPTGAYAGWTIGTVQWRGIFGDIVFAEGILDPETVEGGEVRAVAEVTGPDGAVATLATPFVYVDGSIQSVRVDLDPEGTAPAFAFSFASVEGMASSVEYQYGSSFFDVRVVFADGRGVDYRLNSDTLSQVASATETDLFGGFDWAERTFEYDTEGRILLEFTRYDDETETGSTYRYDGEALVYETHTNRLGVTDESAYADGIVTAKLRRDAADVYAFDVDLRTYDDGTLSHRNMSMDDGVGISWSYEDSVLQYRSHYDYGDAHAYDNQVTFFDAQGRAKSGGRSMDDGRQIEIGYQDGVRSHTIDTDAADVYAWSQKINFYGTYSSPTSYVTGYNTTFDDGRHAYTRYEQTADGERVIRESSLSDLEDAFDWTQRERSYDETGQLTQDVLKLDDGVVRTRQFTEGQLAQSSTSDGDNARTFEFFLQNYDAGEIQSALIAMDDGRSIERQYSDGQLSGVHSVDVDDAFVWAERVDIHDAAGLSSRLTAFDDGVTWNEQFAMGERTVRDQLDNDDAHAWHSILERFEEGVRVSREIIWDDDLIA